MRTITRSLIATAAAAPLLVVGSGAAFASETGGSSDLGAGTAVSTSHRYDDGDRDDVHDDDGIVGDLLDGLVGDDGDGYSTDDEDVLGDLLG